MGEVYLAEDTRLGRRVALKILPADAARDSVRMRRFLQEARAAAALQHPHVAHVYEIGEHDDTNFIVMEYVEGRTIDAHIKQRPLKTDEIIEIGLATADAIAEAHSKGITHRDIKPANIMLTPRGTVKVLDFGLAKISTAHIERAASNISTAIKTDSGQVMGTVAYMSPEQALGREVDHRTDLFSLGTVLYEMATGKRPFTGRTGTETIDQIVHTQPPAIPRFNDDIPQELERIICKCLEKDRERRYQTARELVVDLKNLRRDSLANLPDRARSDEARTRWPARRLAVIALVTILVAFGIYWWKGHSDRAKIDSVAVLPFANPGATADTEYLSDGLTETLINKLSQLSGMKVIARNSVFRYKGREVDAQAVARDLDVQAVLTGRIIQRGDYLSISVELINARDNTHIWGGKYNRKLADLLAVQEEISREISENLRAKLSGEEKQRLTKRYTDNAEAYQLYLQGRYYLNNFEGLDAANKALNYFQRAIAIDPNYALAYAGVAEAYILLGEPFNVGLPPEETLREAKAAATKALAIDDTLGEAHVSLAHVKELYDWDWIGAEREYQRAIELRSKDATARSYIPDHAYISFLQALGRHDKALAEVKRAAELDPLNDLIKANVGFVFYTARQYDQAIEQFQRVGQHLGLGWAYQEKKMYAKAIAEL